MANFNLQMTGAQVKDALNQLINRVAEGWAVGTRDGNPVGSGSPYYQNNAKYYAASAQGSAARAEAAVPSGTAGAVFFDRAQTLNATQVRQARDNIMAGNTNPNLIDNSWFLVNTRNITSGATNNKFYPDRWRITYGTTQGTWSLDENGLTLTAPEGSAVFLQQYISADVAAFMTGKVVTGSVMLSNRIVTYGTITRNSGSQEFFRTDDFWLYFSSATVLNLRVNAGKSVTVRAVKLELKSGTTLANDPMPDVNEERMRCISTNAYPTDYFTNKPIAATSNPNLLDNPWLGKYIRVNQRSVTTVPNATTATSFLDRWKAARVTGTVTNDGVSFAWDGVNGTNGNIQQAMGADYRWNVLTVSANIDGKIYSFATYHETTEGMNFDVDGKSVSMQLDNLSTEGRYWTRLIIFTTSTEPILVRSVKVEKGAVSTLVNDVPHDYAQERIECQRYLFRLPSASNVNVLGFGNAGNGVAIFLIPTPVTMRKTPTVKVENIGNLQIIVAGTTYTPTAISVRNVQENGIMITATCSAVSGSDLAILRATAAGAVLEFSAEL